MKSVEPDTSATLQPSNHTSAKHSETSKAAKPRCNVHETSLPIYFAKSKQKLPLLDVSECTQAKPSLLHTKCPCRATKSGAEIPIIVQAKRQHVLIVCSWVGHSSSPSDRLILFRITRKWLWLPVHTKPSSAPLVVAPSPLRCSSSPSTHLQEPGTQRSTHAHPVMLRQLLIFRHETAALLPSRLSRQQQSSI